MIERTAEPAPPVSWTVAFWRKHGTGTKPAAEPRVALFEEVILPHLNAAYNLARWLTGNDVDAQDVVQEACLRAYRFFASYHGDDGKAWLLAIVRNTSRTWKSRYSRGLSSVPFDEATHSEESALNQEQTVAQKEKLGILRTCLEKLPDDFREVLIMRELEEMSYREIADATGLAIGTVMSRLSRARKRLEECAAATSAGASR